MVPASLFESELFGHRAGAFTGATDDYPGRVGLAEGGTLVLDHVEELPLPAQPKLLRLLSERNVSPLGGRERAVDVRFVSIGPPDLERRVETGRFRGDLFYRLDVLAFVLPPLRRRIEDLPSLLERLLADLAERLDRDPTPTLSARAQRWMRGHVWPGNLRQLRNVLEREMLVQAGPVLDPDPPREGRRPRTLAAMEREHLLAALAYTRGHQGRAAELLGISRKALWEKRKRFGLP